ncbi:putative apoptosis-promoting RNA-binding protein TIA-1/TIAR-like protein, partial [Dinothrombium tinctorium]
MASSNDSEDEKQSETRVYFKGFDEETTQDTILFMFGKFGNVIDLHLGKDNEKFLGYGSLQFDSSESAENAIHNLSGINYCGKTIIVSRFVPREERNKQKPFNNLYVKNFGEQISNENDLRALFEKFGQITSVKVPKDESGRSRGYGFVCFAKCENAKQAVDQMHNTTLPCGKQLY